MFYLFGSEHTYNVAILGMSLKDRQFSSRDAANRYMYEIMDKNQLHLQECYDDKHDKTYICSKGVTFYIQRCY